jgi:hypothetical protein
MDTTLTEQQLNAAKTLFAERQIGRLFVVGSNDSTAPVIDASYRRFLGAMERHLSGQAFMLGRRPAAGDFGLHGQLTQLVGFDPTPRAIAHAVSPRAVAWIDRMQDLSGLDPVEDDWVQLEQQPASLRAILEEIGRVYVPAQLANAYAVQRGASEWECSIDGASWSQRTFSYQAKCLQWTNDHYRSLAADDRERVDAFVSGTGIEAMLSIA